MGRPLRIEHPGAVWHVTSRGNNRCAMFLTDADRITFLALLAETVKRFHRNADRRNADRATPSHGSEGKPAGGMIEAATWRCGTHFSA